LFARSLTLQEFLFALLQERRLSFALRLGALRLLLASFELFTVTRFLLLSGR
jgi:hypothetical protein